MRVTPVHVLASASMSAQVSGRPSRLAGANLPQPAGETKNPTSIKQAEKADLLGRAKAVDERLAVRSEKIINQNSLNISYNKQEALLSVKVQERQTGDLIRELKFKDYKALAYSNHGYKGGRVDITA